MMNSKILTAAGYPVSTLEEAIDIAPAISSINPHPQRTERYSFLSTEDMVKNLNKFGWEVTHANQSGKSIFNRHTVRMISKQLKKLNLKSDNIIPQVIIDNSHDGLTQAMIHMGLFRLVCSNGLVVSIPGMYNSFKFRHIGLDIQAIENLMSRIAEGYNDMAPHIVEMMETPLTKDQKEDFVIRAIAAREPWRFMNAKSEILTDKVIKLNNIEDILIPKRNEDMGEDLWKIFNVIQEKLVNGGYRRLSDSGRKSKTRPIAIPSRNIDFNKDLWTLAEDYLPKKSELEIV